MTLKHAYDAHIKKREEIIESPTARFWYEQEKRYVPPFQMYGNLYYVGDSWVCAHIVDTGDGLLLFDGGNCCATAMLIQSIWEAGFNPRDVKWMIMSHGHVDHIGAANFFRSMFGTKLYLSAPDAEMFRSRPWLSLVQESTDAMEALFVPDVEINEGDELTFGGTTIKFYLVPGHTDGCIACFFDVTDGKEVKRVGYYGGFGFNTLTKEYLTEIGDPTFKTREVYLESIRKVCDEKVDIFMPNHTSNVDLLGKRRYMAEHPEENPFVDDTQWKRYLNQKYEELREFMKNPENQ